MKILRTYILKECVLPFIISLSVLTCVFLLGYLPQLANQVINKGVSLNAIGRVFLFYIPLLLGYTLPIACLATVILTFGRLSADNEILALRANGVLLRRILYPLILVGIVLSLILFLLNDRVIPHAYQAQRELLQQTGTQNPTALLEAGTFITSFPGQVIFIYKIDGNRLYNVRIYQPQPDGKPTRTIIAQEGEFAVAPEKEEIKLKLINGTSDEIDLKNPNNSYKLNFKNSFRTLDLSKHNKKQEKKPKAMTLRELDAKINEMQSLFVEAAPLVTEYFRKITWSFAPLIFILLGFPIAVITHRREKGANILFAILFAAPYYLLSLGCQALAAQNIFPPELIMWVPNIIGGIIVLILNFRLCVS